MKPAPIRQRLQVCRMTCNGAYTTLGWHHKNEKLVSSAVDGSSTSVAQLCHTLCKLGMCGRAQNRELAMMMTPRQIMRCYKSVLQLFGQFQFMPTSRWRLQFDCSCHTHVTSERTSSKKRNTSATSQQRTSKFPARRNKTWLSCSSTFTSFCTRFKFAEAWHEVARFLFKSSGSDLHT